MAIKFDSKTFNKQKEAMSKKSSVSGFDNPDFVKLAPGNKYRFRLVNFEDERSPKDPDYRDIMFVEKYEHSGKDENGKSHKVICPTTFDSSPNGFKSCPICEECSKLYKNKEKGSKKDGELYDMFKRKYHGYVMVYVVTDPTTPDNKGKVKLLHFGKTIADYLKYKVYGVTPSTTGKKDSKKDEDADASEDVDDIYGEETFNFESGRDLTMNVSTKKTEQGTFNNYACEFSGKLTAVNTDFDKLNEDAVALKLDSYRTRSTKQQLEEFYKTVVLNAPDQSEDSIDTVDAEDEPKAATKTTNKVVEVANPKEEVQKPEPKAKVKEAKAKDADAEAFDVDAFMKEQGI